jgi:hypothetical protein
MLARQVVHVVSEVSASSDADARQRAALKREMAAAMAAAETHAFDRLREKRCGDESAQDRGLLLRRQTIIALWEKGASPSDIAAAANMSPQGVRMTLRSLALPLHRPHSHEATQELARTARVRLKPNGGVASGRPRKRRADEWLPDRIDRLRRLVARGVPVETIANELGATPGAVQDRIYKLGLNAGRRPAHAWAPEREAALRALWAKGLTSRSIAEVTGDLPAVIHGKLHQLGLTPHVAAGPGIPTAWTPRMERHLRTLLQSGVVIREVARQLGVPLPAAYRKAHKLGLLGQSSA